MKIILKDRTEINNGVVAKDSFEDRLIVTIPGINIVSAATTFGNSAKTETIQFEEGYIIYNYKGYTTVQDINCMQSSNSTVIYLGADGVTDYWRTAAFPDEYMPADLLEELRQEAEERANQHGGIVATTITIEDESGGTQYESEADIETEYDVEDATQIFVGETFVPGGYYAFTANYGEEESKVFYFYLKT